MPFVGDDIRPGTKRRLSVDHDRPDQQSKDFYLVNQRPDLAPRKILPLTSKRARITTDDDILAHDGFTYSSSSPHRRRRSSQLRMMPVQPVFATSRRATSGAVLAPCHICHRRPTKKSDLDSFAECQGCGERTCFVCIRECQGWNLDRDTVLSEQEALSRSFHMDDVDEPKQQRNAKEATKGWDAIGHQAVVCSRCCIERGAEGDVACLGCFSRMEGS